MLRLRAIRACRDWTSVLPPSPNIRSNTTRGLCSMCSGVVGLRQLMVWAYVQLYPPSHVPAPTSPDSSDSS